ncbi:hypothetical protein FHR81_004077 [Actinoalloteichus hoggarensis]|nr:hypothetical protein [Actinoalloteichus hoggarensis]
MIVMKATEETEKGALPDEALPPRWAATTRNW